MSDVAATVLPASATQASTTPAGTAAPSSGPSLWSHGSFSFKDLLDIVNPLQHLPIIGSIYRYLTGDEPSGGARIVGDALYGGPIGFGVGVVTTMLTDSKGEDLGEQALADVFGPRGGEAPAKTQLAQSATHAAQAQAGAAVVTAATAGTAANAAPLSLADETPEQATKLVTALYRSPLPAKTTPKAASAPAAPDPSFAALNARFRRQSTTVRTATGQVLNNQPVPLELSSNLLSSPRLALSPPAASARMATAAPSATTARAATTIPATNPIAQKMLEALDKYEQLKKKQEQDYSAQHGAPAKVDLTL
jgi:hypothetical protein